VRTPHYLSPLQTTVIPGAHIVFDCETRASRKLGRMAHRWVCGAASYAELDGEGYWGSEYPSAFDSPELMWKFICEWTAATGDAVVWAHNLGFDLRVSEALRWLPTHGYVLEAIVLEKTAAWASFRGNGGVVTVCDLHSWLPTSLARIAHAMGEVRPRLGYGKATDEELTQQCIGDVVVTTRAVGYLMEWLQREGAGRFRPTGSGQSHAMWRRRWLKRKVVLVHGDESALERERTAMWTGRSEAWRWGKLAGPLYEHDLNLAYCRIAAESEVPVKLILRTGRISVQAYLAALDNSAILADVTVDTDTECVPTSDNGRVFWPTGRFHTTLWNPELELLIKEGANVTIHRTWRYTTAPVLSEMARYIIDALDDEGNACHPVVRIMLKHWARTLVGRCALRYREWDDYGTLPTMGLSMSTMYDMDTAETTELLQVGYRLLELADMAEADSSVPQITGWVMSQARVNLWRIMKMAGHDHLYYTDTDCVIVDAHGHMKLRGMNWCDPAIVLLHKGTYSSATIYGPRNIVLEDERRLSGVPKRATMTGELQFQGEVWAGLRASLETRRPNEVGVAPRTFDVEDADPRRIHTENGRTLAFRLGHDEKS
jgi:hypothetical protein